MRTFHNAVTDFYSEFDLIKVINALRFVEFLKDSYVPHSTRGLLKFQSKYVASSKVKKDDPTLSLRNEYQAIYRGNETFFSNRILHQFLVDGILLSEDEDGEVRSSDH